MTLSVPLPPKISLNFELTNSADSTSTLRDPGSLSDLKVHLPSSPSSSLLCVALVMASKPDTQAHILEIVVTSSTALMMSLRPVYISWFLHISTWYPFSKVTGMVSSWPLSLPHLPYSETHHLQEAQGNIWKCKASEDSSKECIFYWNIQARAGFPYLGSWLGSSLGGSNRLH